MERRVCNDASKPHARRDANCHANYTRESASRTETRRGECVMTQASRTPAGMQTAEPITRERVQERERERKESV